MKVLNILTNNMSYNGVTMSLLGYYNYINPEKVQLDFVVPNKVPEELKQLFTKKGAHIYELTHHGQKLHQKKPLKYYHKLGEILKTNHYDAVHVHGSNSAMLIALLTARKRGVKIRIAHSRNSNTDHPRLHKLLRPFFSHFYTHAFACGKEAGDWLFGKNHNFTIIPNGKDIDFFSFNPKVRDAYRKKLHLEDQLAIGHVGNFNYQKNHEFLLEIFNEIHRHNQNSTLILIGTGTTEESIKKHIKTLGLEKNIKILRAVQSAEIAKILNAFDLMVFPSRFEGFPNVLIEWQSNGLPCFVSDVITRKVALTDLVHFLPLDKGPKYWAEQILDAPLPDRAKNAKAYQKAVKDGGYDIRENAKYLEKLYLKLYQETLGK